MPGKGNLSIFRYICSQANTVDKMVLTTLLLLYTITVHPQHLADSESVLTFIRSATNTL